MSQQSLLPQERIDAMIAAHVAARRPKFRVPYELLFPGNEPEEVQIAALREEARRITPAIWTCIGMNSLTEVNLPHYHHLLAGTSGVSWLAWAYQWTAEEKRHDDALHDLARHTRVINIPKLEEMQYTYMCRGFKPEWYGLGEHFVFWYTVFQEDLTTISYTNLVKLLRPLGAPRIAKIMGYIAGEEGAHRTFYCGVMDELAPIDHDLSLTALWEVVREFTMPGHNIPDFRKLALIAERTGMLGLGDFLLVTESVFARYKVAEMRPVGDEGKRAQETLIQWLDELRTKRSKRNREGKRRAAHFHVPFIKGDVVI